MADAPNRDVDEPTSPPAPRPPVREGPYPRLLKYQLLTPRAPLTPGADIGLVPLPHRAMQRSPHPPTWAPDPTGRHQWRWWNGQRWTDHVADDGEVAVDLLEDG